MSISRKRSVGADSVDALDAILFLFPTPIHTYLCVDFDFIFLSKHIVTGIIAQGPNEDERVLLLS